MKDTRPIGYWTGAGVAPEQPHAFQQIDDPGLAAFAIGGGTFGQFGSAEAVVVTDNFLRKSRCGVPGCNRERHDPIHHAPEG